VGGVGGNLGRLAAGGFLGAEFYGPTYVDSFIITQTSDTRPRIQNMDVYFDGQKVGAITLPNNSWQTQEVDLGALCTANFNPTWVTLVATSFYSTGANAGVQSFSFTGTAVKAVDTPVDNVNLNAGKTATASGYIWTWSNTSFVTDGNLIGDYTQGTVWHKDGEDGINGQKAERSVTVNYGGELHNIGRVGIALITGQSCDANRGSPIQVTISGGIYGDGGKEVELCSETITLSSLIQYDRYTLNKPEWELNKVGWLKIEFPMSNDASDWYYLNNYFGLAEFQAFAKPIPEPVTMSLLALGGLAMLRRRK